MKDKTRWKKNLKYLWIIYAIFSIILVLFLIDRLICKDITNVSNRYMLDKDWNITVNDKIYNNVNIDDFIVKNTKKQDTIVLEKYISDDYNFEQPVLVFFSRHSAISAYVDNELIYEYGHDRIEQNKTTGSGYQFINFPDEYKNKTLKIELIISENDSFSKFDSIWISNWESSYKFILTENRFPLLIGSFLVIFGIVTVCVTAFAIISSRKYSNLLLISLFSICIGLWTLCYYNCLIIFSMPIYSINLMQYMALYIAPLPILLYIKNYVMEINNKKITIIYMIEFIVQFLLTWITIILHTFDIMHATQVLSYFHFMFVIHIFLFVFVLCCHMRKSKTLTKISMGGMTVFAICIFYELLEYIIPRYTGYEVTRAKGIAAIGIVIFLGILVIDLYFEITKNIMEKHERELLIKRAYIDELTQIYNRAYCMDYMHDINNDYTIINFDLNDLKKKNDIYGHMAGDKLIISAANVINKSFSKNGIVGRMGGDEFIAIIKSNNENLIKNLIKQFKNNINEVNKNEPELDLSISYGYAMSNEVDNKKYEKVYCLADERMYEYKQKIKNTSK
jgi:diguanylate cyclase (GGDEF)-like protein